MIAGGEDVAYTTEGGHKVHADVDCWALTNGRAEAAAEGKRPHPIDRTTFERATENGRDACKYCYPNSTFADGQWSQGSPAWYDVTKSLNDQPSDDTDPWSTPIASGFSDEPPF